MNSKVKYEAENDIDKFLIDDTGKEVVLSLKLNGDSENNTLCLKLVDDEKWSAMNVGILTKELYYFNRQLLLFNTESGSNKVAIVKLSEGLTEILKKIDFKQANEHCCSIYPKYSRENLLLMRV